MDEQVRSTTVIAVRRDGKSAMAGDGQVSIGATVMKGRARKVRVVGGGKVLAGFAGASADAFSLLDRFEQKLGEHRHELARAAVELAHDLARGEACKGHGAISSTTISAFV